jgi:hypothetical protein
MRLVVTIGSPNGEVDPTVLTSLTLRVVMCEVDPTLPR